MFLFPILLVFLPQDFTETPIQNSALHQRARSVAESSAHFAIDNGGKVAFCYDGHVNRYVLDSDVAKTGAEALLFRDVDGRATIRTTSQAAHAKNGEPVRGFFLNFLRVDHWSNVWFCYRAGNYRSNTEPNTHLCLLQIDRRGDHPNKSWDFDGIVKNAYFGDANRIFALTELGDSRFAIDTYRFDAGKLKRLSRQALPGGVVWAEYDFRTRRCVGTSKTRTVVLYLPTGAKRDLPIIGNFPRYIMARGKVFCQDGIALYEDAGSDWKSLGDIRLLAASADGRKWLVYRPGEGVMLRTYKR